MAELVDAITSAAISLRSSPRNQGELRRLEILLASIAANPDRPDRFLSHYDSGDPLLISCAARYVYCPRLFFYEWVDGVFRHSSDTVEGALRHEKLERREDALPPPEEAADEKIHSRSVELSSDTHRLIARINLVEGAAGAVVPVDCKKGRPRDTDDGPEAWSADRVQVCAQAPVLRDNGYTCDQAVHLLQRPRAWGFLPHFVRS